MRRYIKKQVLELLVSLSEAHTQLEVTDIFNEDFVNILADLQEVAVVIGNQIDEAEGENTVAVRLLEEYCEVLWEISQSDNDEKLKLEIDNGYCLLSKVSEEITYLKEDLDIVFLPYKASMWDCMETVWRAACEDSNCKVYVIPIPYYNRNKDGSLAEMHYEGDLLPDYVQITSYKEYLLSQRHPEVVYIHNPYDEYNHVTCVHPDFFSAKLQKETEMLVYIPYFLMGERLDETHSLLPAYVYADKIVLRNEKIANVIDASIPREKFVLLGCPKRERMLWMEKHKEELKLPTDWYEKVRNKKVVFYNISVSGLLKDKEAMLNKMEEVISIVEKRKEVTLLYRPHPLAEATMSSMCPELLEKYKQLVEKLRQMDNVIYDTNADVGISVAISDVYIGERTSSVVDMFKTVHKPIFYLTKEQYYQPTWDEMQAERMYDVCRVDEDLWFVTHPTQMLCKYNLKKNEIEFVADIPETAYEKWEYSYVIHYDGKLIIIPNGAQALCIYDIQKKTFRKDYFKNEDVVGVFGKVFLDEHYLYLTPSGYPAIVRYDILAGHYEYYSDCIQEVMSLMPEVGRSVPFSWGAALQGDELFLASSKANIMVIFNIRTQAYKIVRFGAENNNCVGMVVDDDYCWMIQLGSTDIIRWSRENGETKLYTGPKLEFETDSLPYINILEMNDILYLIPHKFQHIYCLDKKSEMISYAGMDVECGKVEKPSKVSVDEKIYTSFGKEISDTEFVVMSLQDNAINIYDIRNGMKRKVPVRLPDRLRLEVKKRDVARLQEKVENNDISLNKYLSFITEDLLNTANSRVLVRQGAGEELQVGEKIHKTICDSVLH